MSFTAVIVAAGSGTRSGGPKQWRSLGGRAVVRWSVEACLAAGADQVIVVIPEGQAAQADAALAGLVGWQAVTGGAERAASVQRGLAEARADLPVLVHDAARPNLAHGDLDALFDALAAHPQGAILAAPVRDTLKRANDEGDIAATEPREKLWRAFTPQAFPRGLLAKALGDAATAGAQVTDEAMAMERIGIRARLVEGREDNFKITTPADLARFEFMVARR